jgi:transposase
MLHLSSQIRYFFYNGKVDMRKGCYGLCGLVNNELQKDLYTGDIFIFMGKRRNSIKLLQWDRDGFVLYQKHLVKGCFVYPLHANEKAITITPLQLQHIFEGVILKQVVYKKRFVKTS